MLTGLLFGLFHGDVWRFIPAAVLGIALSAIALATDSIVPAMVAHFANNACLIALARARPGRDRHATMTVKADALTLVALGRSWLAAGAALLARAPTERAESETPDRRRVPETRCSLLHQVFVVGTRRPLLEGRANAER